MKTILILSMLVTLMSSTYAQTQTYYLKKTTQRFVNESGTHYKPFKFIPATGTVRLEERKLILKPDRQQERVYLLDFEPVQTYKGLYFTATFEGRAFEIYYNMECHEPYMLIERGAFLSYYHFKKEL